MAEKLDIIKSLYHRYSGWIVLGLVIIVVLMLTQNGSRLPESIKDERDSLHKENEVLVKQADAILKLIDRENKYITILERKDSLLQTRYSQKETELSNTRKTYNEKINRVDSFSGNDITEYFSKY